QGPYTWTYPMKQLKGKFQEGRIIYNNNPMLRWCLLNTGEKSLNRDGIESVQPVKASSTMRIDGMVSLLNAFCSYTNHEEEYMRYVK
ncbi:MAG: terminase large subunit, partial [Clostridia bacterium]|nr:terminase large subunit [Clostridia bacterium]